MVSFEPRIGISVKFRQHYWEKGLGKRPGWVVGGGGALVVAIESDASIRKSCLVRRPSNKSNATREPNELTIAVRFVNISAPSWRPSVSQPSRRIVNHGITDRHQRSSYFSSHDSFRITFFLLCVTVGFLVSSRRFITRWLRTVINRASDCCFSSGLVWQIFSHQQVSGRCRQLPLTAPSR